jgi:hypothetical protein
VGKRLLVGLWSRKRGVPGPDEPAQPVNEDHMHSYLLSGVFCASESNATKSVPLCIIAVGLDDPLRS